MTGNEEGKALVETGTFDKEAELNHLMEIVHGYLDDADCKRIMAAFNLADKAHAPQKRASGQ